MVLNLHPHMWIRTAASRIIGAYLSSLREKIRQLCTEGDGPPLVQRTLMGSTHGVFLLAQVYTSVRGCLSGSFFFRSCAVANSKHQFCQKIRSHTKP